MDREEIRKEYETTDIKPKALAEKHGIKYDTLKSRMKRDAQRGDKWEKKEGAPAEDQGALSCVEKVHPTRSAPAPPNGRTSEEEDEAESLNLTPKQRRFVDEYLIDLNATQAAIRAGYSAKTAEQQGYQLLQKTAVREAIDCALAARSARVQVDADWVLKRLVRLADFDLRDFAQLAMVKRIFETKSGEVLEDEIQTVVLNPDFDGTIAKSLNQDKDGIKLEMPDRVRALELVGRHIGMWDSPHRKHIDEQRLQIDRERFELEKTKQTQQGGGTAADGLQLEVDYGDGEA